LLLISWCYTLLACLFSLLRYSIVRVSNYLRYGKRHYDAWNFGISRRQFSGVTHIPPRRPLGLGWGMPPNWSSMVSSRSSIIIAWCRSICWSISWKIIAWFFWCLGPLASIISYLRCGSHRISRQGPCCKLQLPSGTSILLKALCTYSFVQDFTFELRDQVTLLFLVRTWSYEQNWNWARNLFRTLQPIFSQLTWFISCNVFPSSRDNALQ